MGDTEQKEHSLSICDLSSVKTELIEISELDIPHKGKPGINIPGADTLYGTRYRKSSVQL